MNLEGLPERPRLAPDILLESGPQGHVLRCVSGSSHAYSLGHGSADLVERIIPLLDGRPLEQLLLAVEGEFEPQSLLSALGMLDERWLIVDGQPPTKPMHGRRCYRELRVAERGWQAKLRATVFARPELTSLDALAPEDWRRWYRGWWAETLYFAAHSPKRLALLASRDAEHRGLWIEFFAEEHDHLLHFCRAARGLGLDPEKSMRRPPLPESAALASFIQQSTRRSPLYFAWVADQVERAQTVYMIDSERRSGPLREQLMERLADYPEFLDAFLSHADIEQGAAHASTGREVLEQTQSVSPTAFAELLRLAEMTEWFFARKEAAIARYYGRDGHEPPHAATNELAALGLGDEPRPLASPVRQIIALAVERLAKRPPGPRGDDPGHSLAEGWSYVVREWAAASLETPSLALHVESRYPLTRLAVTLCDRAGALDPAMGASPSLDASALAAVVADAAHSDATLGLAQAALLLAVEGVLGEKLSSFLPAGALVPLRADLTTRKGGPLEALDALGTVGPLQAQAVGSHLQIVGQLCAALIESTTP